MYEICITQSYPLITLDFPTDSPDAPQTTEVRTNPALPPLSKRSSQRLLLQTQDTQRDQTAQPSEHASLRRKQKQVYRPNIRQSRPQRQELPNFRAHAVSRREFPFQSQRKDRLHFRIPGQGQHREKGLEPTAHETRTQTQTDFSEGESVAGSENQHNVTEKETAQKQVYEEDTQSAE